MCERVDAIRAVRIAAHELANVCSAVTGGTEMAISLPTLHVLTDKVEDQDGEQRDERANQSNH
jgi:hypothetical protein